VYLRGPTMNKAHINVTISDLIREAQPYQRQIVIFRDPVERYQSAFYYYR
jgi:N-acetylgalactosamine 4-sulfate 6-O-sulfotransferase